ncbi:hypothetical protein [Microvirga lotononidis]|uniref:Uncharacterized protein n=1 Tax=Microvirga lotononidis TaxID=864069 RepID=I4YP24_9HYPH|nr:hypothetical protein [Microvirga lotononidis]EIM25716.1 hypothetical protein MicloDRAFT_00064430 [Microvirga lotononidis]WQO25651.1 hypothetical protein U0023_13085 [Microvirga lotononidis]
MSKKQPLQYLPTLCDVHRKLGGTVAIARLTGKSAGSISNAKRRGFYPRDAYAVMRDELERLGSQAPASLWRQVEPLQNTGAAA